MTSNTVFLSVLVTLNTLICAVSCHYSKSTNKINCDEPFKFCSNNRPNNEPKSCERNGGYPDDLNFDTSTTSDYSQYRSAMALKPCFNKEMEDLGFDEEEKFRTIDVFTENNFRVKPNIGYEGWKPASEGYGGYDRLKRQALQNNNLGGPNNNRNAISVVFEEPGSRMSLIDYLNDKNIPERSCFNDSYHLDGKELYKRLCFPNTSKKAGSASSLDEMSFNQCTYESDRSSGVQRRSLEDAFNQNERQLTPRKRNAPIKRMPTISIVYKPLARIVKHIRNMRRKDKKNERPKSNHWSPIPQNSGGTNKRQKSKYKNSSPTSTTHGTKQNPKASYNALQSTQAESPPKPPTQTYGVRIRQRRDFPCNDPSFPQHMRLCENLKKDGRIVECGDRRFSKCDSEWDDCIEEDEKYLREKTDYYKDNYGDTCPTYSPNSQDDPYPGQPFVQDNQQNQNYHQYNQYNSYQQNNNQHSNRRQEEVTATENNCRVYTAGGKGERIRCDTNIEVRDVDYKTARDVNIEELDPCQDGSSTSSLCFLDEDDEK